MRARLLALFTALALVGAACGNSGDDDTVQADERPSERDDGAGDGDGDGDGAGERDTFVPLRGVPGVTDEEIRVSVVTAETNPLGGKYAEMADGMQAYFDMVNAEGGIYGRELKIASRRDDALANNQAEVQATLAQDDPFAVFIATILFTGADLLAQERVPTFGWNINPEWIGHDNMFPNSGALCFGCRGKIVPWLAGEIGATKVGILGYGVSEQSKLCASGNRDSFEEYKTAEVVFFDDSLPFGVTDLSSQVAEMKDKGVEFITTCMDLNGVFTLAKEMDKQDLDAVQHMPNGYDEDFMAANGEFFEGDYVVPQFTAFEHDPQPPLMEMFFEWMDKLGKDVVELSFQGWIAAHQFVTGLELAGPEFDREKVIAALNSVTDFDAEGLIAPIDWTKQHEDPAVNPDARGKLQCANFVQVQNGKFVSVFAEGGKPWVCFPWDGELEEPRHLMFVE